MIQKVFFQIPLDQYLLNFANIESPQFEMLSHSWQIPSDQQTPGMIGSVYGKSTVLSNLRFDPMIVKSLKYRFAESLGTPVDTRVFARGDLIIMGPTELFLNKNWGDLTIIQLKQNHWLPLTMLAPSSSPNCSEQLICTVGPLFI